MSGFVTEAFIEIGTPNANPGSGVRVGLQGTVAPGNDSGEQDAASIGSLYHRTDNGQILRKKANAGATADWEALGTADLSNLVWRQEKVIAATDDSVAPGAAIDITAWTDNESVIDGDDAAIGDHFLVDCNGTPVLLEMTAKVSATSITLAAAAIPIADNNTFVVQNYLPDTPAAQEKQAVIHFPTSTSPCVKLSDFNWELADGISTTGTWAPTTGAPVAGETLEVVTEKLEQAILDLVTLSGVARNATNFGAFTTPATLFLSATETTKSALQKLADLMAQMRGVEATGITAVADVDTVPIATVKCVQWWVEFHEEATPSNRQAFRILALNDGTSAIDFNNPENKLKVGAGFNWTVTVDISAGNMRLRMGSSSAGIAARARRMEVIKSVI